MVELWVMRGMLYAATSGLTWITFVIMFDQEWFNDNPLPIMGSIVWPVGLPVAIVVGVGLQLVRTSRGWLRKRRELQKELDEARRKKDEQDAADVMKEGYR